LKNQKINKKRVLGIDVGTAIVGWSILDRMGNKLVHVESDAIITSKDDVMSLRLLKIFDQLNILIDLYKPDEMAVEDLFFFKNKKTVISVAEARGVILLAGSYNKLKTFDYTPLQVKSAVTGYGRAEKKQVQFMTAKVLQLKEIPKLDDVADAMAVGICHLNTVR